MFAALYAPSAPLASLVDVARGFSPRFESYGSLVVIDASGLSRLFGSPLELGAHLHTALVERVNDEPSRARVAIAATQVAAALVALGGPGLTVVTVGDEAAALAPLSLTVLRALEEFKRQTAGGGRQTEEEERRTRIEERNNANSDSGGWSHPRHTHQASRIRQPKADSRKLKADKDQKAEDRLLDVLSKWGIRTLGEFAALPGPEVYERLGGLGVMWQRLASGEDSRPLVPWVDEVPFEATLELEWPVDELEPLSFVLARLLEPLSLRLEQADRGAAVLHTALRLTTKAVVTRTLQLPTPMRDPKTLRTLILLDLESHPPAAAVDTVRVFIEPTPGRVLQWTLLDRAQPAPEQVSTLVARLSALMGNGHVGSPRLLDSWRPGAFEMAEFTAGLPAACLADQPSLKLRRSAEALAQAEAAGGREGGIGDRKGGLCEPASLRLALRRFRLPIPARVQMAEGRPVRVITDRHGLSSGAITNAAGPWRTSGEWWQVERDIQAESRRSSLEHADERRRMGQVGRVGETGHMRRQVGDDWSSSSHSASHSPDPPHPLALAQDLERATARPRHSGLPAATVGQSWDRDEWDVAMHDGTIYRLSVERSAGQWFLEGIID